MTNHYKLIFFERETIKLIKTEILKQLVQQKWIQGITSVPY